MDEKCNYKKIEYVTVSLQVNFTLKMGDLISAVL